MSTLDLKRTAARYLKSVQAVRNGIIFACAHARQPTAKNWVRFVMYHDVTPDEQPKLARQMRYIRNIAEFVSIDDALALSSFDQPPNGRFICVTVDDGYASGHSLMTPVFEEFDVPGAFFVVPQFIEDHQPTTFRHARNQNLAGKQFLTWDQCRDMVARGMTIGSHTFSHAKLAELTDTEAAEELDRSARMIAKQLGVPCRHFAAPWGQPGIDFRPDRDTDLIRAAGYQCLLTTVRGRTSPATTPYHVPREQLELSWANYHLRFFLS